jgi:hypothetical protein
MKKLFIAAAALAVSVTSAEAICTKKSLNGSWFLGIAGEGAIPGTASGGTFNFSGGGTTATMTVSSFSSTTCKGSGTGNIGGTPFTFTINSEKIPGSAQKPNQLFAEITVGGSTLLAMLARR